MQAVESPTPSVTLTEDQRWAYERDGYLAIDPEIPAEVLDGVVNDLDGKYVAPPRTLDGVLYSAGRIQDAWKVSANVKAVALAPKVLGTLEQLYNRKPLPFQTLNFSTGTEQPTHSDTIHFNSSPATYMCGVWVALEDIDMDMGPLMYYGGSHKLPEITIDDLGPKVKVLVSPYYERLIKVLRRLGPARRLVRHVTTPLEEIYEAVYYPYYEPFIAALVARHGMEPLYATIKKGQAFIWSSNLLHGGSPIKGKSRTRHSQVTHFFFEGCKYYTPLLQRRSRRFRAVTCWRNPEWIV
jgi:hypothetical protein